MRPTIVHTPPLPSAPPTGTAPVPATRARRISLVLGPLLGALAFALILILSPSARAQDGAQETDPGQAPEAEATAADTASAPAAPPPTPPTCEAAEHAEFDFWVGDWDVYRWRDEWDLAAWREENPDATPSRNVITKRHAGCTVYEDYTTPGAYTGSSLNFYDRTDGRWHQVWIDSTGVALFLAGGLEGAAMVLSDAPEEAAPAPEGQSYSRITWTPQPDGSVRQTWEQSRDGETWQVAFDGRYVRRGGME